VSDLVLAAKYGGGNNRFRGDTTLTADLHAVALRLDVPAGVKSAEISARQPDGGTDVLLYVKDIPADWPTPYIFKRPVLLRRGTTLSVTSYGGAVKLTVSRY
jgi:hypothetical protein